MSLRACEVARPILSVLPLEVKPPFFSPQANTLFPRRKSVPSIQTWLHVSKTKMRNRCADHETHYQSQHQYVKNKCSCESISDSMSAEKIFPRLKDGDSLLRSHSSKKFERSSSTEKMFLLIDIIVDSYQKSWQQAFIIMTDLKRTLYPLTIRKICAMRTLSIIRKSKIVIRRHQPPRPFLPTTNPCSLLPPSLSLRISARKRAKIQIVIRNS